MDVLTSQADVIRFFETVAWPYYRSERVEVIPLKRIKKVWATIYWDSKRQIFCVPLDKGLGVDDSLAVLFHEMGHLMNGDVSAEETERLEAESEMAAAHEISLASLMLIAEFRAKNPPNEEDKLREAMANDWARRKVPFWTDILQAIEETLNGVRELSEEARRNRAWAVLVARAGEMLEIRRRMKEDRGREEIWQAAWQELVTQGV